MLSECISDGRTWESLSAPGRASNTTTFPGSPPRATRGRQGRRGRGHPCPFADPAEASALLTSARVPRSPKPRSLVKFPGAKSLESKGPARGTPGWPPLSSLLRCSVGVSLPTPRDWWGAGQGAERVTEAWQSRPGCRLGPGPFWRLQRPSQGWVGTAPQGEGKAGTRNGPGRRPPQVRPEQTPEAEGALVPP